MRWCLDCCERSFMPKRVRLLILATLELSVFLILQFTLGAPNFRPIMMAVGIYIAISFINELRK